MGSRQSGEGAWSSPAADDKRADEDDEEDHAADHRHQQHGGVGAVADDGRRDCGGESKETERRNQPRCMCWELLQSQCVRVCVRICSVFATSTISSKHTQTMVAH